MMEQMMMSCYASSEEIRAALHDRSKSAISTVRSSGAKGIGFVFAVLFLLVVLISMRWMDDMSFLGVGGGGGGGGGINYISRNSSHLQPPIPIPFGCPNTTVISEHICTKEATASPLKATTGSTSSSCPDYFRYIHEDLRPWKVTGITREMVEGARGAANVNFRLVVLGGRAFVEHYSKAFQTRDVFTLWGILQLLNRYPGRVPDLDLMFNCDDMPVIKAADFRSKPAPPLFRYCKDDSTLDIVFPDWSFWGWSELHIKPWELLLQDMEKEKERLRWGEREPYAYWKGNPGVSGTRQKLMKCDVLHGREWNARFFAQDWEKEIKNGFKESDLAKQCRYRYKIFVEGRSWSVSQKYILACDSPTLRVATKYHDFFSRGLTPGTHYWPIRPDHMCESIKFAVDWGNRHPNESQAMGKQGSGYVIEQVKMDYVYDYMLHLLRGYAGLMRYKPTIPEKAKELCLESVACPATGKNEEYMMGSREMYVHGAEPCTLPPPFKAGELKERARSREKTIKQVESLQQSGKI